MRYILALTALLATAAVLACVYAIARSAKQRVTIVTFIIPEGLEGPVVIEQDVTNGGDPIVNNGHAILHIGQDGRLRLRSLPFGDYQKLEARFADGSSLMTDTSGSINMNAKALRSAYGRAAGSTHGPEAHFIIGTEKDLQEYRAAFGKSGT